MAKSDIDGETLRGLVQGGSLPLEIRLYRGDSIVHDQTCPHFVQVPRLSYLSDLLSRLRGFFLNDLIDQSVIPYDGWFEYEDVPLKWQYPVGLLYDLFSSAPPFGQTTSQDDAGKGPISDKSRSVYRTTRPWPLTVHFLAWPEDVLVRPDAEGKALHDSYINSVKEADFLRNGTAKAIMSLSKDDSVALWKAVCDYDMKTFNAISRRFIDTQKIPLRHVPIKFYLPASSASPAQKTDTKAESSPGHVRVMQTLATPVDPENGRAQTIGSLLHREIKLLFPSRNTPIFARPILHGAVLPMQADIETLLQTAAYLDGWLHIAINMIN